MNEFLTVQADYRKTQLPIEDIAYITVEDRKTKITRRDGSVIKTNTSLKDVYAALPEDVFSHINRGIVISSNYVKGEKNGVITMTDGTVFRRRVRSDRPTKRTVKKKNLPKEPVICPAETMEAWLGPMPMPMVIMELVYEKKGVAFYVRYMNEALAKLEGVDQLQVRGRAASELRHIGSAKWMAIFADVAINGSTRVIEDTLGGKYYQIHCYQPQNGYCALALCDVTKETALVRKLFRK